MDSNHHGIATASPSSWCVCQFRHDRLGDAARLFRGEACCEASIIGAFERGVNIRASRNRTQRRLQPAPTLQQAVVRNSRKLWPRSFSAKNDVLAPMQATEKVRGSERMRLGFSGTGLTTQAGFRLSAYVRWTFSCAPRVVQAPVYRRLEICMLLKTSRLARVL